MHKRLKSRINRMRITEFDPSHDEVSSAIKEFIKNGGKIKKIDLSEPEWKDYTNQVDREADFYLMGRG
ncbi:MAG: hypothetical protein P8X74_03805 [Reinekea sp.]